GYTYMGPMTAYQALAEGKLVPAVEAAFSIVGTPTSNTADMSSTATNVNKILSLTNATGSDASCYQPGSVITKETQSDKTQCYGGATIGQGLYATPQHTLQAYATLADSGKKIPQTVLLKVALDGITKYTWTQPKTEQVIGSAVAQGIVGALSDSNATWLQADKSMFTASTGTHTAISYGMNTGFGSASNIQFTSKYVAGFWVYGQMPASSSQTGQMDTLLIPVTYSWLNAF
ncbi:MAG TPA: hypothetical protein VMB52_02200, partial [Verrucomicrobiae bacterium]|nr:hypothetical protein [Verrucomicrobiae bacterium]